MEIGIKGRVALVSAASSGLGFGVAAAMVREGATVCICGRDSEKLAKSVERLRDSGPGGVDATVVDLRDPAAVLQWVEQVVADHQRLDIVVSNTGGVDHGDIRSFQLPDYRTAVESTMLPHIGLTLATLPHLQRNGWGRIVYMTSESVREPMVDNVLSGTVRSGISAFAKNVANSYGRYGITANVVAPGYHRTAALDTQFGDAIDQELERLSAELPVGRVGDPAEFGDVVTFLTGESAGFISGAMLVVDGGKAAGI
ncbi:SDR family oxidoreductase [Nocardia sp. NPDC050793]|uniref:SDR family oxidoreductase n=1 Tax=Nocardia sp. NPDC050793 TaxID=3155159 RepID=UPI0033FAC07F